MRLTIKCSIAILENNHQSYLFSKRKKLPYINYFEFPGGKLNEDEKPYDALLRECKEEIGIIITDAEYINTIKQRYLDFDVILLDGGVFITYFEYHLLKDRCNYLLLDDTNIAKNKEMVDEIKSKSNKWKILGEDSSSRNGNLVCQRIYFDVKEND